jgi:hypothetical protein
MLQSADKFHQTILTAVCPRNAVPDPVLHRRFTAEETAKLGVLVKPKKCDPIGQRDILCLILYHTLYISLTPDITAVLPPMFCTLIVVGCCNRRGRAVLWWNRKKSGGVDWYVPLRYDQHSYTQVLQSPLQADGTTSLHSVVSSLPRDRDRRAKFARSRCPVKWTQIGICGRCE